MKWTEQNDARLLVAILANSQSKIDWKAVAEFMGEDCTASAVQHRIQRLKEMAAKSSPAGQGSSSPSNSSPAVSPVKRGRGRPKKNTLPEEPETKKAKSADNEETTVKLETGYK